MRGVDVQRSLDDRTGLHRGDLREGDGQAAAAVTHHRVELMQGGDDVLDLGNALAHILGEQLNVGLLGGDELVQRGIEEADGHRTALERDIHGLKVALLHRLELGERLLTLLERVGANHLADGGDTVSLEEHMLGAAEADALGAELDRLRGIVRVIGVGADAQTAILVRPAHDAAELAADGGVDRGDCAVVDVAGGAVDGEPVALVVDLAGELELLVLLIHLDVAAAGDAALAHAARHDGRVGGHAAADGQDALRGLHALNVLGRGLETDEHDLLAALLPRLGVLGGEDDLAAGRAGRGGQRLADNGGLLEDLGIELGMEQRVERAGLDHGDGFLLVDHALVHEVAGDLESGGGGALAVTGLEHIELSVLDGELHILHIAVMILKDLADVLELLESLGELLGHLGNGHRGTDAGDDVLALRVGQELAHELLLAGGGVAGEGNAGAAVVAHVAERHGLDVDGGAPGIGDIIVAAIDVRAGVVPAAEDRLDRAHELLLRVGGEFLADLGLVLGLELARELLEIVGGQLDVEGNALLLLHLVDELLEILLADLHNDVGIHLDEAAVAVPRPAGIVGLLGDDVHNVLIEAEVQDGIHHAGHGRACAGADGNEQRIVEVAELLAGDLLHLFHILHDLGEDLVVDLAAVLIILGAGLGGDGEALRDRQADVGHLGQVRALTAEQLAHIGVALGKQVTILFAHNVPPIYKVSMVFDPNRS